MEFPVELGMTADWRLERHELPRTTGYGRANLVWGSGGRSARIEGRFGRPHGEKGDRSVMNASRAERGILSPVQTIAKNRRRLSLIGGEQGRRLLERT